MPRETCTLAVNASKEPWLTEEELIHVINILAWAQKYENMMSYSKLIKATLKGQGLASLEGGADGVRG